MSRGIYRETEQGKGAEHISSNRNAVANRNVVAKKAGVSGATVSRVFNNPETVSDDTKDKILKAASELNYHPNLIARNFARRISGNIGVIIPHIPNVHIFSVYYFSELLSGIGEALEENNFNLMLFFHTIRQDGQNDYSRYFNGGKVDGCILLGTQNNDEGLMKLKESGYNFCLINNYIPGSSISFIDVDNVSGSYVAIKHLISLGHKRIAFLNGPATYTNSTDRLSGYISALRDNNIELNEKYILYGNYGRKSGYSASDEILKMKGEERPTAVFAANDRMAAGLLQGLKEKGVQIPEDVAVVGYDDSDTASIVDPQLTSVRIPFFQMGRQCVSEFVKQIEKKNENFSIFIKPELVIRATSGRRICNE